MPIAINNPRLSDGIGSLRYIGPLFRDRFRKEGINTLQNLKDVIEYQSRAQNIRLLRKILENPRKEQCVGTGRYDVTRQEYKQYCVRRVNQLAWYAVITYLKQNGVDDTLLPSAIEDRGAHEQCSKTDKCKTVGPADLLQRRYNRIPYYDYEHIVLVMLNTPGRINFTGEVVWRLMKRTVPLRNISAVLAKNSGTQGRKLFDENGKDRETHRTQYKLKSSLKKKLKNKNLPEILEYLRKL
jgi:hypothetical protein